MPFNQEEAARLREATNIAYGRYDGALTLTALLALGNPAKEAAWREENRLCTAWQTASAIEQAYYQQCGAEFDSFTAACEAQRHGLSRLAA